MHTRRSFIGAAGGAGIAATAGCLDFLLGDDLTFEATAASVRETTLSETGYAERRTREQSMEREFEAGDESRTVGITNWHAEYDKSIEIPGVGSQRAATFTATTTPQAEVLGQTFNPIDDMDTDQIVGIAQDRYEGMGTLQHQGERQATLLGKTTTVNRFTGSAELADSGQEFDVEIQYAEAVESGDDFALAIGGYPQQLAERGERDDFFAMLEGVQHDG